MKLRLTTFARLAPACFAALAVALPGPAAAEARSARGEWVNSSVVVWKNPFGQCWQGGHWMPAVKGEDCGADAPMKRPAMLLSQSDGEQYRSAVLHTVADNAAERRAAYRDGADQTAPGNSRITSCFTNHN